MSMTIEEVKAALVRIYKSAGRSSAFVMWSDGHGGVRLHGQLDTIGSGHCEWNNVAEAEAALAPAPTKEEVLAAVRRMANAAGSSLFPIDEKTVREYIEAQGDK